MDMLLVKVIGCKVGPLVKSNFVGQNPGPYIQVALYRKVQLDFTLEMEVFQMMFERCDNRNLRGLANSI